MAVLMSMRERITDASPMRAFDSLNFDRLRERVRRDSSVVFADAVVDLVRDMTCGDPDQRIQTVVAAQRRLADAYDLLSGVAPEEPAVDLGGFAELDAAMRGICDAVQGFADGIVAEAQQDFGYSEGAQALEEAVAESVSGGEALVERPSREEVYAAYQEMQSAQESYRDAMAHMDSLRGKKGLRGNRRQEALDAQDANVARSMADLRQATKNFEGLVKRNSQLAPLYAEAGQLAKNLSQSEKELKDNGLLVLLSSYLGLGATGLLSTLSSPSPLGSLSEPQVFWIQAIVGTAFGLGSLASAGVGARRSLGNRKVRKEMASLEGRLADATKELEFNLEYEVPEAAKVGENYDPLVADSFLDLFTVGGGENYISRSWTVTRPQNFPNLVFRKHGAQGLQMALRKDGIYVEGSGNWAGTPPLRNKRDLENEVAKGDSISRFKQCQPKAYQALMAVLPEVEYAGTIEEHGVRLLSEKELQMTDRDHFERISLIHRKIAGLIGLPWYTRPLEALDFAARSYSPEGLRETLDAAGLYFPISALTSGFKTTRDLGRDKFGDRTLLGFKVTCAERNGEERYVVQRTKFVK